MKNRLKPAWMRYTTYTLIWAHVQVPLLAQLPVGESVSHGQARFHREGASLVVSQDTDRLIVNWDSFSVGGGHQVRFDMPGSGSAALNRVLGGSQSMIDGVLQANGRLFLVNPQGIVVGPGGVVRAHSFVGSGLNLSDADFLGGGDLRFAGGSGAVVNLGRIEALGGDVFLVGGSVRNSGTVTAPGSVGLAAGSDVLIRPSGEERIFVSAGAETGVMVDHTGTIRAGNAEFKSYGSAYTAAMNLSGLVEAGRISGSAGQGDAAISGELRSEGGDGEIAITAARLDVRDTTRIAAVRADGSGGRIRIGGGYQGMDADLINADMVYVAEGALLSADGLEAGRGGEIIVWSDDTTRFYGELSARGGELDGDGGFAEVSGKRHLDFRGTVNLLGGGDGEAGTLLLDPTDLLITGTVAVDTDVTAATPFQPSTPGASSLLSYDSLTNALNLGNVTVRTLDDGGSGTGMITFGVDATDDFSIPILSNRSLTLEAWGNLVINADIDLFQGLLHLYSGTSGTGGDIIFNNQPTLRAGSQINVYAGNTTAGIQNGFGRLYMPEGVVFDTYRLEVNSGRVAGTRSEVQMVGSFSATGENQIVWNNTSGFVANRMELFLRGFEQVEFLTPLQLSSQIVAMANRIGVMEDMTVGSQIWMNSSMYADPDSAQTTTNLRLENAGAILIDPSVTFKANSVLLNTGMEGGVRPDFLANLEPFVIPDPTTASFNRIHIEGFDLFDPLLSGGAYSRWENSSLMILANDIRIPAGIETLASDTQFRLQAAAYVPGIHQSGVGYIDFRDITDLHPHLAGIGWTILYSGKKPAADGGGRVSLADITYGAPGGVVAEFVYIDGFSNVVLERDIETTNAQLRVFANQIDVMTDSLKSAGAIFLIAGTYAPEAFGLVGPYDAGSNIFVRTGNINFSPDTVLTARSIQLNSAQLPGGGALANFSGPRIQYYDNTNMFDSIVMAGMNQVDFHLLDSFGNPIYEMNHSGALQVFSNSLDLYFDTYRNTQDLNNIHMQSVNYLSLMTGDVGGTRFHNADGQTTDVFMTFDTQNIATTSVRSITLTSSLNSLGEREDLNLTLYTPGDRPIRNLVVLGFGNTNLIAGNPDRTVEFMARAALASEARNLRTMNIEVYGDLIFDGYFNAVESTTTLGDPLGVTSSIWLSAFDNGRIETLGDSVVSTPQGYLRLLADGGIFLNTNIEELRLARGGLGDVIINERDSLFVTTFGNAADTGNLVIAAQGDILIDGNISRAGGDVFLLADADRSAIFGAGTGGADGTGAILGGLSNVGLLPNFQRVFVANSDFTVTYNGSIAGPNGTVVSAGDVFYGSLSENDLNIGNFTGMTSGGEQVWAIRGYTTSNSIRLDEPVGLISPTLLQDYNSLGLGNDILFDYGAGLVSFSADVIGSDTPVDTSIDKFGNPTGAIGSGATLNMSGQWYTRPLADIVVSDTWVVRANTPLINSVNGNVVLSSGYQSEWYETFAGSGVGAPADLFLRQNTNNSFETITPDDFVYNSMRLNASAGNIFAAGFRDIIVQNAASLSANNDGEITLWAARDVRLEADAIASNLSTLNLIGGGVVTNRRADETYATLSVPNLIATAGIAVDLQGEFDGVSGGLNDATYWADLTLAAIAELDLDGGLGAGFAHRDFVIRDLSGDLTVQTHENQQYIRDDLDGDFRVVGYPVSSGVIWDGIVTSGSNNDGNVFITTQIGDMNVDAQIFADTGDATLISAGAIRRSLGTDPTTEDRITANTIFLDAQTFIGTGDAERILTDGNRIEFTATEDVWLSELNDVTLAGSTEGASRIDFETEDGDGSVTLEQVRTGSGSIRIAAGMDASGGNILDGLAAELGSGTDDLNSAALNLATTGDLILEAGGSIGGDGGSIDSLQVHGATVTATTLGTGAEEGIYLTILDTAGGVNVAGPAVQINSGRNIDITARESTTGGTGSLSTAGIVTSDSGGYIRLAADRNVLISHDITAGNASGTAAPGAGNIVLRSGIGGTSGSLNIFAPVTSEMDGEINLLGLQDVNLNGAMTTAAGSVLVESLTGDIRSSFGGMVTANDASFRASQGQIGTVEGVVFTDVNFLVAESLADQYFYTIGPMEYSARTLANGRISLESEIGSITVGEVAVVSTLTPLTGGVLAPGAFELDSAAWGHGVRANGTGEVNLISADDLILNQDVTSGSGNILAEASSNIIFNGGSQMNTTGNVEGIADSGAIIDNSGSATSVQIVADRAILTAATGIGSGAMFAAGNLGTDVNTLGGTVTGTGDVNIYEVDGVTLADVSVTDGSFRLETGGLIDQEPGAGFLVNGVGSEVELDTTRATLGHALIAESGGNLNLSTADIAGDYIITSTGEVIMNGDHNIARDFIVGTDGFRLAGGDSTVGGEFQVTGTLTVDAGLLTLTVYGVSNVASEGGLNVINELITEAGGVATITARFDDPDFDLAGILNQLPGNLDLSGVTEYVVNLRGETTTFTPAEFVDANAVVLTNQSQNQIRNLIVRTGNDTPGSTSSVTRDYNLVQSGAVSTGTADLTINAVRAVGESAPGAPFTPGLAGGIGNTWTDGTNTFDETMGSTITLDGANSFGRISIRDATQTVIRETGDVLLGLVNVFGDFAAQSDSGDVIVTDGAQITANNGSTITYQSDSGNIVQQSADGLTQTSGLVVLDASDDAGSSTQRMDLDAGDLRFATGGDLYVDEVVGDLNAAGTSGGETDILLSVADRELTVTAVDGQNGIVSSGDVRLTADNMDLINVVDADGRRVTLVQLTDGREVTLGNEVAGTLSLTQAEINQITALTLQVGNNDSGTQTVVGV
ncbi:MAG: filamentous hemagglutinin N-terminal domain-containing protein, partial [Kiritimatiellae bacterium]|nr:filamentous hemagglutinin N-terminal domain-containing protein [Kiritimatiellia bacterium]